MINQNTGFKFLIVIVLVLTIARQAMAQTVKGSKTRGTVSVWGMRLDDYLNSVDQKNPMITGGCVTMTSAALSETLFMMSLDVSENHASSADRVKIDSIKLLARIKRDSLKILADEDNRIFQSFISAYRLPHQTSQEERARTETIHQLLIKATGSPLISAEMICSALSLFVQAEKLSFATVFSDVKTAETMLDAAFRSMLILASDNIGQLPDSERAIFQARLDTVKKKEFDLYGSLNAPKINR